MRHSFVCTHKRITLRQVEKEDIEWIRKLRNQPQIRCWFNYSGELTAEQQEKWYEDYLEDETDYMYVAVLADDPDVRVGTYADYHFDAQKKTIEAGRLMVDSANVTQRGLGYDVVGCAVKLVFENLPVDKIVAEIFTDNIRSMKCTMGGGGFRVVGEIERDGRKVSLLEVTRQEYNSNFEREFK